MVFINTKADMKWLRDVHLPKLAKKYKSAVIRGNEDYPTSIEVYSRKEPLYTDTPLVFKAGRDDVFRRVSR